MCGFDLDRFFADILLTPLEATRIRLVSERGYASGLTTGFARLVREGGVRELYAGFIPILFKYVEPLLSVKKDTHLSQANTLRYRSIHCK